jgi:hypothetical protein
MKKLPINNIILFFIIIPLVIVILLALISNTFISETIHNLSESNLNQQASSNLTTLYSEISELKTRHGALQKKATQATNLRYPTLQDIKDIASKSNAHLLRMERQTNSSKKAQTDEQLYSLISTGDINNLLKFLKQLEDDFILETDAITLQRYNDDGSILALAISLTVREQ